jgi:hypothetical protein
MNIIQEKLLRSIKLPAIQIRDVISLAHGDLKQIQKEETISQLYEDFKNETMLLLGNINDHDIDDISDKFAKTAISKPKLKNHPAFVKYQLGGYEVNLFETDFDFFGYTLIKFVDHFDATSFNDSYLWRVKLRPQIIELSRIFIDLQMFKNLQMTLLISNYVANVDVCTEKLENIKQKATSLNTQYKKLFSEKYPDEFVEKINSKLSEANDHLGTNIPEIKNTSVFETSSSLFNAIGVLSAEKRNKINRLLSSTSQKQ